jgi:serine/threonine protein kinase/WD40 repeat protein
MGRIETASDRDERLGEAIEAYLELAETGVAPDAQSYASRYPDLSDELREALEGLAVVQGLVGSGGGAAAGPLRSGGRLAGYRIVRELGRGGMGVVYDAVHLDLDRPVALKVLAAGHAPDSSGRRRFLNEAKTAAALHHTYIVPVFDVGQAGGLCYYAMQRIEGCGLDRILRRLRRGRDADAPTVLQPEPPPIPSAPPTASWHDDHPHPTAPEPAPDDADAPGFEPPPGSAYYLWIARLGQQAAEALEYAHRRGVVHRDVKPSNLLIDRRGMAWVADFGLARRDADPALTQSGAPLGTPRYMSPEQATNAPVDGRTDVFSLGATLYELLALRPAFDGSTTAELIRQITTIEPVPPRKIEPRVPRDLETIVLKAMAKRPADRYARAQDLADDLARFQAGLPVRARRIGPVGRFARFARRHPFSTSISLAAAAIVLTVVSWAYWTVLQQRNAAQRARDAAQAALDETRVAVRRSEEARARQLASEASLIRRSALPNSRREGLARLREAVALVGPDAALRPRLRDEAIELLGLRDLEAGPSLDSGRAWGVAFGPGGTPVATLSEDGAELALHDPRGTTPARRIRLASSDRLAATIPVRLPQRDGPRLGAGLAAAGPWLVVVDPDQAGLALLVPETGARYAELRMPDRVVEGVHATPDGRRLITIDRPRGPIGPGFPETRLRATLWDPKNPSAPVATLADPDEGDEPARRGRNRPFWQVPLIAVSPDSTLLALAWSRFGGDPDEEPDAIRLLAAEDGQPLGHISGLPGQVTALALGPGDLLAAAVSDGTVRFWERTRPSPLLGLYHQQKFVHLLRFSPDGSLLALAGWASGVEFWEPTTNALVATVRTPERVGDLAFAPDGRTVAATTGDATRLWSFVAPVGRDRLSGFESRPVGLAFDADGRRLAIASWNAPLRLWNLDHSGCAAAEAPDAASALNVTWAGGDRLLTAGPDGLQLTRLADDTPTRLIAWDDLDDRDRPRNARRGTPGTDRRPPPAWIIPLARTPDAAAVALARQDRLYLLRDLESGTPRPIRLPHPATAPDPTASRTSPPRRGPAPWHMLALARGGHRLYATNLEGSLQAWDLDDAGSDLVARPLAWSGHPSGIRLIAASGVGDALVAVDPQGRARPVSTDSGWLGPPIIASEQTRDDRVTALAFAPDGVTLALGFQQGGLALVRRDESGDYHPLVDLPGHRGAVGAIAFDPEGRRLASSGDDKAVQVWHLERLASELAALGLGW